MEALTFARQIAKEEIESIERIHSRTLKSFAYIGLIVAGAAAVLGYIGYANLKDAAITSAQRQMRTEVVKQVQDKLTKENIENIVQDQVRNFSATKMSEAIHKELMTPSQSAFIRQAAASEAKNQIKQQFAPRHFTEAQSDEFVKAVNSRPELSGFPVTVMPWFFGAEPEEYANAIKTSVARTKLKLVDFQGFTKRPVEGVAIYRDESSPEIYARRLQEAFSQCGISTVIVAGNPSSPTPSGQQTPMVIFVGPRLM